MSTTSQGLCEEINQAFRDVPLPEAAGLTQGRSLGAPYAREHFGNKLRGDLPHRLTSYLGEDLAIMSEAGLKYYLPAFMIFLLTEKEQAEEGVLNQTLRGLSKIIQYAATRESRHALTPAQQAVIAKWANHILTHLVDYGTVPEDEQLLLDIETKASPNR